MMMVFGWDLAIIFDNARRAVSVRLVRVTTALALTADFRTLAVWQVFQKLLEAAFLPIGYVRFAGKRLQFTHDGAAQKSAPVASIIHLGHRAHVAAGWTIVGTAKLLISFQGKAAVHLVALAAAHAETAVAAFFWYLEARRRRQSNWRACGQFPFQIAMLLYFAGHFG